jgi:pyruvate dehydrogenase E2 component (dihydrolipoamide acetyltransferase)
MREIIMPKLGLSMETGTIGKWLKKEGDRVEAGEILLEVESDKATIEVEAFHSGTLLKILKHGGTEVRVTTVIGYIGEPGEEVPPETAAPRDEPCEMKESPAAPSLFEQAAGEQETTRISPVAKKLAEKNGIDPRQIAGTGPSGRIVLADVERAVAARTAPAGTDGAAAKAPPRERSREPIAGTRKVIAERLTWSAQNIPHITLTVVVDAGPLVELKRRLQAKLHEAADKLTVTDFILRASALVLAEQPAVNSALVDGHHVFYEDINVGFAADTGKGLVVPTIYSADRLSVVEIARARTKILEKVRGSRHAREDISNGTFTVTNLGMFGIRNFTAIINPPQSAILIVGEIYRSPVAVRDTVEIGTLMQLSLAVDHRTLNGAEAARFLSRLREVLQAPAVMIPSELA